MNFMILSKRSQNDKSVTSAIKCFAGISYNTKYLVILPIIISLTVLRAALQQQNEASDVMLTTFLT